MNLILASGSPRRRELLEGLGLNFRVISSDVPEVRLENEPVETYVVRLAAEKASSVARRDPAAWVVAADTVVCLDGEVLEKPADVADAERMLRTIAGRRHTVFSGVSLQCIDRGYSDTRSIATDVDMASMTDEEISWYAATGEPLDKAGSYAVQGIGAVFVDAVHGNYTNVVGLPLPLLYSMFRDAGVDLFAHSSIDFAPRPTGTPL
jgi:septum formation protein